MIALAFGALMAVALAALLIWFVLKDRLFILYATLFFLQALYIAYLSGQGFDWPGLSVAVPLASFAWNVPVGLSGAVACLFTREIADLKHFSPRIYAMFGWLAVAFVIITVANLAKFIGLGILVNALGNLLVPRCRAVHHGGVLPRLAARQSRGRLVSDRLGLLEGFTMTAAVRFLVTASAKTPMSLLLRPALVDGGGIHADRPRRGGSACARSDWL